MIAIVFACEFEVSADWLDDWHVIERFSKFSAAEQNSLTLQKQFESPSIEQFRLVEVVMDIDAAGTWLVGETHSRAVASKCPIAGGHLNTACRRSVGQDYVEAEQTGPFAHKFNLTVDQFAAAGLEVDHVGRNPSPYCAPFPASATTGVSSSAAGRAASRMAMMRSRSASKSGISSSDS